MPIQLYGTDQPLTILPQVKSQLVKLMFNWQSPMRSAFRQICANKWAGRIVWAQNIETNQILAWGLLVWKAPEDKGTVQPEMMLYTRRGARGRGLAKQVFWGLRNTLHEKACYTYYPHDKAASTFYTKMYELRNQDKMPKPEVRWLKQ